MGKRGPAHIYRGYMPMTVDLYQSGLSVRRVAARLNAIGVQVSHEWVRSVLAEKDVEMRGYRRRGVRTMEWRGKMLELRGRHTVATCRAVLDRYAEGEQPKTLSKEYDIPVSTIEKLTDRAGIIRSRYEAAVNRAVLDGGRSPIALAKKAATMYVQDKMSLTQISDAIDITPSQILHYLRREGVQRRSQSEGVILARYGGPDRRRKRIQEVCRLYHADGLSKAEISRRTGRCWRFICDALESEYNVYAVQDYVPWWKRADGYVRQHGHVEGITRLMLAWIPAPEYAGSRAKDQIREPLSFVRSWPEAA